MSKYTKTVAIILTVEILLVVLGNVLYLQNTNNSEDKLYRVEAKHIAESLRDISIEELDLSEYDTIVNVEKYDAGSSCKNEYVIESVDDVMYRIEYNVQTDNRFLVIANIIMLVMILISFAVLLYVKIKVLVPFERMSNLSTELAKGNLTMPIKEEKNKYFGKFLWSMDMLRENMEEKKEKELQLQRERKTLILSLSHDIKTPLSAIDLYAKALQGNLYDTEEKRNEVLQGILKNTEEIKNYVNEITRASREDFLNIEIKYGEFYLSDVINYVEKYYRDKLSVLHTNFIVDATENCLLKGDKERFIEVIQNILENAIKYGDGREIHISFDEEEDCKFITVENTGENIPTDEFPNLFDSFYRGSNSKDVKGSGLGLYICKYIMRKMDGDVFIKNKKGVFSITIVSVKA